MDILEHTAMLIAKERMENAVRFADQARALRLARVPRPPVRVRLGMALVRFGHWIQGRPSPGPACRSGLRQAQS